MKKYLFLWSKGTKIVTPSYSRKKNMTFIVTRIHIAQ